VEVRVNVKVGSEEFNRLRSLMTDSDNNPLTEDCSKDTLGFIEVKGINETITIGCYEE